MSGELRRRGGGVEATRGLHAFKERSIEGNHGVSLKERTERAPTSRAGATAARLFVMFGERCRE